jgi:hypothetical protein
MTVRQYLLRRDIVFAMALLVMLIITAASGAGLVYIGLLSLTIGIIAGAILSFAAEDAPSDQAGRVVTGIGLGGVLIAVAVGLIVWREPAWIQGLLWYAIGMLAGRGFANS